MSSSLTRLYSRAIQRSGFNSLYSFVPFKIIRSYNDEYTILLTRLSGFKVYGERLRWMRGIYDEFNIVFRGIVKRVKIPVEINPITLSRNSNRKYIYLRYNREIMKIIENQNIDIERHLEAISNVNLFREVRPVYIEFSYKSLTQPHVCRYGYVLLSSDEKCPLENICSKFRRNGGSCKYYIKVDNTYVGLYHVYPLIEKQFAIHKREQLHDVIIIPFNGNPLIKIRFTEYGEIRGGINSVVLIPKISWLFFPPRFYLYPSPTIGVRLKNVHALILEFEKNYIKQIIRKLLSENPIVFGWLALKYNVGRGSIRRRSRKIVDGFRGLDELSRIFNDVAREGEQLCERLLTEYTTKNSPMHKKLIMNEDFISFASFVLVHSLVHLLITVISAKYYISEDVLMYHIEHPIIEGRERLDEDIRLIIFEDAIGGYGYLKNIYTELKKGNLELLEDIITKALEIIRKDEKLKASDLKKNILLSLTTLDGNLRSKISEQLENVIKCIEKTGIYPHIIAFRRSILGDIDISSIDEHSRGVLENIFSGIPLCWDGCPHCVMLERGCTYSPYDQVFLVSKNLAREFLSKTLENIKKPSFSAYLSRIDEKAIENMINNAEREILISTAYLSPKTIDYLLNILNTKQYVDIKVLASTENLDNLKIIEKLKDLQRRFDNFNVKFFDNLHAKGIVIDELILIKGSFNFTKKGLSINLENIDIVYHPKEIRKFKESFENIWERARSI